MKGVGNGVVIASSYLVILSIITIVDFITTQVSNSGKQLKISKDHLSLTCLDQVLVEANPKVCINLYNKVRITRWLREQRIIHSVDPYVSLVKPFRLNLKLFVLVARKFQKVTLYIRDDFQSVCGAHS